jgi:hypothetical protein
MKKLLILLGMVILISATDLTQIEQKGGYQSFADSVPLTDSVRQVHHIWGSYLEGYATLTYKVTDCGGDTKVRLLIDYSNDGTNYFGRVTADSLVAATTTKGLDLSPSYLKPYNYIRFTWDGFGTTGDTAGVFWGYNFLPKKINP